MLTLIGAYSLHNNGFDIWLAIGFGILGYVFRVTSIPLAPMVIALVLGRKAETGLRQSLQLSGGDFSVFFTRPVSAVLMIMAFLVLAGPIVECDSARNPFEKSSAARRECQYVTDSPELEMPSQ